MYIYTEFENNLLNTAEEVYTLKTVRGDDYTNSIRCLKWLSLKGCYSVKLNFIPSKLHMHIFIMSTKCMHGLKKILYKLEDMDYTNCLSHNVKAAKNDYV